MDNYSAGDGTPYWYEWSVGLLYAVKMLNPDNKIYNVVLQSHESHSLDDVVVTYEDETIEYIQVKNTREGDTLTFSDMITSANDEKKSYLEKFSTEWKELWLKNGNSGKVILFSNREFGKRKYKPKNSWERPPLKVFWEELSIQVNSQEVKKITDVKVEDKWTDAWDSWKAEMKQLTDDEKLNFLRSFTILASQEDLDGLIDSIANELQLFFNIDNLKAIGLHQKLCYRLMWWSTSLKEKEEISREDIMEALSLSGDEIIGEHILSICEPFFKTRIEFVEELEKKILHGKSKVTFLTGEPGCGKTNIVNYLACKPGSIVTVRFHAFKPILPGELYLSADAGISDPKAFWGSLLIMFRQLFSGKLYKYKVPVSIEMIDSIEKLRQEVIRLAVSWSKILGKPSVIVVDGIDHAARSGEKNTFLKSLFLPEAIPENVRFLLVGQPVHQFAEYPNFLSDSERIEVAEVPNIQIDDLELLYTSKKDKMRYDELNKSLLLKYIAEKAKGNTLSAVFAMQEATMYGTFEEFEKGSNVNILASGIEEYYEYIWKSALKQTGNDLFVIDMYLTAIFSLINRKIDAKAMNDVFNDMGMSVWQWENILQNLFPIINYDNCGYSVFHNDIRIFLFQHYNKARELTQTISSKIADFLVNSDFDIKIKHEMIFKLLKDAKRASEYVDVFTCKYVVEGFMLKRSLEEIQGQMRQTLDSLMQVEDKRKIIKFSCAVTTMQQYKESLHWHDKKYQYEEEIPFALISEKKTIPDVLLNADAISQMFADVICLVSNGKENRAKSLLERWMGTKSPESLYKLLDEVSNEESQDCLDNIFTTWGKYARRLGVIACDSERDNEDERKSRALFCKGWLGEAKDYDGINQINITLRPLLCVYEQDLEEYYEDVIKNHPYDDVVYLLTGKLKRTLYKRNQITACAWAVRNNRINLCSDWLEIIKDKKFNIISEVRLYVRHLEIEKEKFLLILYVIYILSYIGDNTLSELKNMALSECDFDKDSSDYFVAGNILVATNYIAHLEQCILCNREDMLNSNDFKVTLDILLENKYYNRCFRIDANKYRKKILESIIRINDELPQEFRYVLLSNLKEKLKKYDEVLLFESYWGYLVNRGEKELVQDYFDIWMGKHGKVWEEDLSERDYKASVLLDVADKMKWTELLIQTRKLLNVRSIGYVGRKDYSLFNPLQWFGRISEEKPEIWKKEGILLLNISEYASRIGDNRANVQVASKVASASGKMGVESLLEFANMKQSSEICWIEIVFDGVISAIQTEYISEMELVEIWKVATKIFHINELADRYDSKNTRKKIYIADIHVAIRLCAERLGYKGIEKRLNKIAPIEFTQKRLDRTEHNCIIPDRWYESVDYPNVINFIDSVKTMDLDKVFECIQLQYDKQDFSWDFVKYFLRRAKIESLKYVEKYKAQILAMLNERPKEISLEYDNCYRLYEELFQYLNETEIENVLKNIIDTYYYCSSQQRLSTEYGLMTDLEHFAYTLFSKYGVEDNIIALQEILQMHCMWIGGSNNFEMDTLYELKIRNINIKDWMGFCKEIGELLN